MRRRIIFVIGALTVLGILYFKSSSPTEEEGFSPGSMQVSPLCETRIGDYVTIDRANEVKNDLSMRGINAWIEYHGSLYDNTRTYVVFAELSCQ